jgi:hypothetical protein
VFALVGCGGEPSGEADLAEARKATVLIPTATFDSSCNGFTYVDDTFGGTNQPNGASGTVSGGALHVTLGPVFNAGAQSGGWRNTFTGGGPVSGSFFYRITPSSAFERAECNEVRVTIDGTAYGSGTNPWVARVCGPATTSGTFNFTTGSLAAGAHIITIGG